MTFRKTATCLLLAITLGTSACSDPVADAKRKFEIVRNSSASVAKICASSRAIADAYLAAGDQEGYREAVVHADGTCLGAQLDEQYGFVRDVNGNVHAPIEADDLSDFNENEQEEVK